MDLVGDIKGLANELGMDLTGFCPVERLEGAPADFRPRRYLENAATVISLGRRLNIAPIRNLPVSRSAYMLEHDEANRRLDRASQEVARFLEERGHDAIGFDTGAGFYHEAGKAPERFAGDFSHKHAAAACGLGVFGVNNLVLYESCGAAVRFVSVITSANVGEDRTRAVNVCPAGECRACVDVCPVGALNGWEDAYEPATGWRIDKQACYDYIFTTLKGQRCGLCIKACPVGLTQSKCADDDWKGNP